MDLIKGSQCPFFLFEASAPFLIAFILHILCITQTNLPKLAISITYLNMVYESLALHNLHN
jgi:hypothetical protein